MDSARPTSSNPRLRGALLVALAAMLWSSGGLFIKVAPMPALAVAGGRAAVTALFYLAVLRPNLLQARWSTALVYALMILTFVSATKLTTAANAIFLQYTGPAYVLLLSPLVLGEKLSRRDVSLVALSLAGMGLLFVGKVEAGSTAGNLLGVASGAFFGATVVLLRRDATRGSGDAMPSTTLGNLLAAALALPFAAGPLAETFTGPQALPALGVLLWLGVVQMGLAYIFFAKGLKSVPASEASLLSMLEPVFNPVWVLLGTGETPGPWALAGGAVVLAAAALRAFAPGEQKKVSPPRDA
ncbi:MAG TPA: EamA family transporter [Myxococcales bacterium]|jgi:drug/metabolite transporter (DMT)-like permease